MKQAVSSSPVFVVLWVRFAFAALLMTPFCLSIESWSRRTICTGALLGAILFGSFALLIYGLQNTTASNTGMISGLAVIWVPLLGWFLGRRIGIGVACGVGLCLAGIGVLSDSGEHGFAFGDALVMAGSFFTAIHILGIDRFSRSHRSTTLTLVQIATVAVLAFIASLLGGASLLPQEMNSHFVISVTLTAALSTAFAFWVQTKFQQQTSPTRAAIIYNLEPAFSMLFAALLLGEALGMHVMIACSLIIAGMSACEFLPARTARTPEAL